MYTTSVKSNFSPRLPIHRRNVRSARSDIITVSCDFMKRLFQFFPPFFHWIFDENGHSSPRWLLSDFSLSLSFSLCFNLLLFFIYIYIFFFSLFFLHFFPSIIRVFESEENRWSGVTRNKRRKDLCLPSSGKRIDYVRGSCLTRSISSCTSIRSRWHDDETKIDDRFLVGQREISQFGYSFLRSQVCHNWNKDLRNRKSNMYEGNIRR